MFGPEWKEGCPSCSFTSDHVDGALVHLAARDVTMTMVSVEADIRAVIETVHKAHHDKDAAAIVSQYVRDAVVFDLAPPLLSGIGTDPRELGKWLDTWEGPIDLESRELDTSVGADLAVWHGFFRLGGAPKSAGHPISFWMRATVCLRREEGAWRIVHEHTSVPFYMDGSFRAALDLEP